MSDDNVQSADAERIARLKELVAFHAEVGPLEIEMEEARSDAANDRERFATAMQVFEEKRMYWRQIQEAVTAQGLAAGAEEDSSAIVAPTIEVGTTPLAPAGMISDNTAEVGN